MSRIKMLRNAILALAGVLLLSGAQAQEDAKSIAIVLTARGSAEVQKGTDDWSDAEMGVVLDSGDGIRTGGNGFLSLIFTDDKSQLKIRPNSKLALSGSRDGDDNIAKRVNMELGELFAEVQKQKGSLQVATPTSVASVKGTQFWVLLGEGGNTTLLTLEGLVELLNLASGETLNVGEGQAGVSTDSGQLEISDIDPNQIPSSAGGELDTEQIELRFLDEDGNEKRLIIDYTE